MQTLTIVVIGRNDVGHLARTIKTIKKQIKEDGNNRVSLLYADDNSDDGSDLLAKQLFGEDRFCEMIVSDKHLFQGGIRNFAIKHLQSLEQPPEYFWFHDSDDYIAPHAIKRILNVIDNKQHPDCISVPVYTYRPGQPETAKCPVMLNNLQESAFGPVGPWAQVIKTELYVPQPDNQLTDDTPWHFEQWDKFNSWAKVEGDDPCYIWDNSNPAAITRTVDFCGNNSISLITAAFQNVLIANNLKDRWISDILRNLANMYDVRHKLTKQWVKDAWAARYKTEVQNMLAGYYVH